MDMALLPALDALLTEGNVTRAAIRLGISQPALSAKLARLRDLTGDMLLVPSGKGRGMVLTPRGVALRTRIREALAVAEAALGDHAGFDPSTSRATVRIIANDNAASVTLAVLLARLAGSRAAPRSSAWCRTAQPQRLLRNRPSHRVRQRGVRRYDRRRVARAEAQAASNAVGAQLTARPDDRCTQRPPGDAAAPAPRTEWRRSRPIRTAPAVANRRALCILASTNRWRPGQSLAPRMSIRARRFPPTGSEDLVLQLIIDL
jgi:DNA-binding transcriptional LysR family regulator